MDQIGFFLVNSTNCTTNLVQLPHECQPFFTESKAYIQANHSAFVRVSDDSFVPVLLKESKHIPTKMVSVLEIFELTY